ELTFGSKRLKSASSAMSGASTGPRFPSPAILTFRPTASLTCADWWSAVTARLKLPTAPENEAGRPADGSGWAVIVSGSGRGGPGSGGVEKSETSGAGAG